MTNNEINLKSQEIFELSRFFKLSGLLKNEKRKGWILKTGIKEPESVADHTFRMTLMAMIIGDINNLDTCKMIRMAILHDLGEAITGDLLPQEKINKKQEEENAMEQILNLLPKKISMQYSSVWRELKMGLSLEAKLVKQIDRFEMAFQALEYSGVSNIKNDLLRLHDSAKNLLSNKLLIAILDKSFSPNHLSEIEKS